MLIIQEYSVNNLMIYVTTVGVKRMLRIVVTREGFREEKDFKLGLKDQHAVTQSKEQAFWA